MAAAFQRCFNGLDACTQGSLAKTRSHSRNVVHSMRSHGSCSCMRPGPLASAPVAAPAMQHSWSRRRAGGITCGGLKKETKKLAKTLKAHRKRLESLLTTHAADTATMQMVLSEINQLQCAVNHIRETQKELKRAARAISSDSSSDSGSDCEDDACSRSGSRPGSRAAMVIAASSVCVQLEPPTVDQELPDITQQLPPPQQYSSSGRILVCQGKACMNKGGLAVLQAASHAASATPGIEVLPCKCLGKCKQGPAVRMRTEQPGCTLLTQVDPLELPAAVTAVFSATPVPAQQQQERKVVFAVDA